MLCHIKLMCAVSQNSTGPAGVLAGALGAGRRIMPDRTIGLSVVSRVCLCDVLGGGARAVTAVHYVMLCYGSGGGGCSILVVVCVMRAYGPLGGSCHLTSVLRWVTQPICYGLWGR